MKLIPNSERNESNRCWFCRTNKSVKYVAKMVNTNPLSENRYMDVLVCNKCAFHHLNHFIEKDGAEVDYEEAIAKAIAALSKDGETNDRF